MALNPRNRRPLRVLAALFVIVIGLYGLLASVHTWGEAQLTPKLGLDLEGGTQLILEPRWSATAPISQGQIDKAVDIIRQRVDGSGVAEAEVTTQGGAQHRHLAARQAGPEHGRLARASPPSCASAPCWSRRRTPRRPRRRAAPRRRRRPRPRRPRPPRRPRRPPTRAKATAKPSGTASTSAGSAFPQALRAPSATTPTPTATATPSRATRATPRAPRRRAPRRPPQPHGSEPDRRERCHRHRE